MQVNTRTTKLDENEYTHLHDHLHGGYTSTYIHEMDIGDRLDKAMKNAGFLTQKALEIASGVPQPTIARILKGGGRRGPETDTLIRLASACNVTVAWLTGEDTGPLTKPTQAAEERSHHKVEPPELIYASRDEISLLTAYREATNRGKLLIRTAIKSAEKDEKKIHAIKNAL